VGGSEGAQRDLRSPPWRSRKSLISESDRQRQPAPVAVAVALGPARSYHDSSRGADCCWVA